MCFSPIFLIHRHPGIRVFGHFPLAGGRPFLRPGGVLAADTRYVGSA
jgi:hypothetical protein